MTLTQSHVPKIKVIRYGQNVTELQAFTASFDSDTMSEFVDDDPRIFHGH